MKIARWLLLVVLLPACGGEGGGTAPELYSCAEHPVVGAPLTLSVPTALRDRATLADLAAVCSLATPYPACRTADGSAVELLLAQTCGLFEDRYLFPDNLPAALDTLDGPEAYVAKVRETDKFTSYVSAASFADNVQPTIQGERAFIGIRFHIEGEAAVIAEDAPLIAGQVLRFTRAWYDGVEDGDAVLGLVSPDGGFVEFAGLDLEAALALLPRTEGAVGTLRVQRAGETGTRDIPTAAEDHIGFLLPGNIAYLSVRRFTDLTGDRVREDVAALEAELDQSESGAVLEGLILDLRGNGGGSVAGALELSDYLIDRDTPAKTNPILTFENSDGLRDVRYLGDWSFDDLTPSPLNGIEVLTDGDSASASEIVIGALRGYDLATTVGTRSFGKGVSQDVRTLLDGSALLITSRFILPPDGQPYHDIGFEPDVLVDPETVGEVTQASDPQLDAALALVGGGDPPLVARSGVGRRATGQDRTPLRWWLDPAYR